MKSKEKLMAIARLIVDTCTPDEISMLCIALLDANLKCKYSKMKVEG